MAYWYLSSQPVNRCLPCRYQHGVSSFRNRETTRRGKAPRCPPKHHTANPPLGEKQPVPPKNGSGPIRRWRRLDDRRPGPLVEVNRLSDVDLLRNLDHIIHFDVEVPTVLSILERPSRMQALSQRRHRRSSPTSSLPNRSIAQLFETKHPKNRGHRKEDAESPAALKSRQEPE